ncbi:MAG: lipoate--protein ligase family protein [Armatimonadetes bacterium]|nr:lipoate--protein ligase family protein [Armatimonadota bacterium]
MSEASTDRPKIELPHRQIICSYDDVSVIRCAATTVKQNLAMDEQFAQLASQTGERTVRFWWGGSPTLVLGCADKPEVALDLEECGRRGIGWVKRITGGGTVLQSSGIFNYSYTAPDPGGLDIKKTFETGARFVIDGLAKLGLDAHYCGISDIAVGDRKISGNAQARKWRSILLHGSVLVEMDFDLLTAVLRHPCREPDYRRSRCHCDFLTTMRNLSVTASLEAIEAAFVESATAFLQR